jgi:hypothetical protein
MTLKAVEFIRRFLLHVLPSGFVHIRHLGPYGLCRPVSALEHPSNGYTDFTPGGIGF